MVDRPLIAVLGSVHMDLIATAQRYPRPGESVNGESFSMTPGGKGGNQACQCAKLGADTYMITQLGDDLFGAELAASLETNGVNTSAITIDAKSSTGASTIFAVHGDYSSIIHSGSAAKLPPATAAQAVRSLGELHTLVLQLELPVAISAAAAEAAAQMGARIVLNASPAPRDSINIIQKLMPFVTMLIVNNVEAGQFVGRTLLRSDLAGAARTLGGMGPKQVVITAGKEGAVAWDGSEAFDQKPFPVTSVDAVGAGDAFLGTLVVLTAQGMELPDALLCAAAAGALATTKTGALGGLPTMAALEAFLEQQ